MSTQPTDEEIDAVTLEVLGYAALDKNTNETARLIARAVLGKWGTPPAVAKKPYGYVYTVQVAPVVGDERKVERTVFTHNKPPCEALALYTTPQPTQAQAGAVPMTPEQRDALWESCKYDDGEEWTVDWEQIVDAVELHHGIKGGQHGAE